MPSCNSLRQSPSATPRRHYASALILACLAWALGGCVLFTPPTGVCLGAACRDLEAQRLQAVQATEAAVPKEHQAPDFYLPYPGEWGILSGPVTGDEGSEQLEPVLDQTDPSGLSTLRIAVGRSIPLDGGGAVSEGLRVLTLNQGLGTATEAATALATLTRRSLAQNFSGEPEIFESETTLGGREAYQVAMVGVGTLGGPTMRYIARAGLHRSRGYIVMLTVPDVLYAGSKLTYDRILDGFEWREGDPTYRIPDATNNPVWPPPESTAATSTVTTEAENSATASSPVIL